MNFVDGTIFPLGDGTACRLSRRYDLSTNPMIRHIDSANGTLSMVRPIHLVDGTTHQPGRWYDLMVGPILIRPIGSADGRTDPPGHDTTCLGRWYNPRLFTWSMGRPIDLGTGATHPLGHWRRSAVLKLVTVLWSRDVS
jgi:hypothetical protein